MIARLVVTDVPFWQPVLAALLLVISVIFILAIDCTYVPSPDIAFRPTFFGADLLQDVIGAGSVVGLGDL